MENKEYGSIQELIEQFDFLELSDDQRELVMKYCTEVEYMELRSTLKKTVAYFDAQEELSADASFKPIIKPTGTLRRILNYKIPLHKVAAIVVVVLAAEALLDNSIQNSSNQLTEQLLPDTSSVDNAFIREIEEMKKYSSHNSIKYNTGLGRVY